MKILVTGGVGYIGIHTCIELLNHGHQVVIVDSLINSNPIALERLARITNKKLSFDLTKDADILFHQCDIRDRSSIQKIFKFFKIESVFHFAGLKSITGSQENPLEYYSNNVSGSIILIEEMIEANVKKIIFSSSAMVYGNPKKLPIDENFPIGEINNPYGQSKYIIERILRDIYKLDSNWKISILRYFNPVGAHDSGLVGEDPIGVPSNLMPYICQVASGKLEKLKIFGNDYHTNDGTGIRDYIHVVDLARSHLAAFNLLSSVKSNISVFNIGTGSGTSVMDLVSAFEKINGVKVPYEFVEKRKGDVEECWMSSKYVEKSLGWKANYGVEKMCEDAWRWQNKNPNGY